jgi:RNA polymerase sigma factor (sigma-70 family)
MAHLDVLGDEDLITACREGRAEAWEEVHRRFHRLIRSIALSYGATAHDADEVVQITFAILHRSIDRLAEGSRLAPWLSTVARRHTWRVIEARRRETPSELDDGAAVHDDVRDHEQRSAEDEVLRMALRRLPPKCRTLLEALYLRGDEPAYSLISVELGIPVGSIGPTRSRCLDKLRVMLAEIDPDGRPAGTQPTDEQKTGDR